jgi:hypothetical protein
MFGFSNVQSIHFGIAPMMETSRNVIPAKSLLKNLSQWGSHLAKVLIGKHG